MGGARTLRAIPTLGSSGGISDFTALGDPMNTTARLASLAAAGELLASAYTVGLAGLDTSSLQARTVEVRGRDATLEMYSLGSGGTSG